MNKPFDSVSRKEYYKAMKKPFGIRLGDEQRQKLEEIAKAEDRSVSAVMRRMIDEGIKKKKVDTGKAKRSDAL